MTTSKHPNPPPLATWWLSKLEGKYSAQDLKDQVADYHRRRELFAATPIASAILLSLAIYWLFYCSFFGHKVLGIFFFLSGCAGPFISILQITKLSKHQKMVVKQFLVDQEALISFCELSCSDRYESLDAKQDLLKDADWTNGSMCAWWGIGKLKRLSDHIPKLQAERRAATKISGKDIEPDKAEAVLEKKFEEAVALMIKFDLLRGDPSKIKEKIYRDKAPGDVDWESIK